MEIILKDPVAWFRALDFELQVAWVAMFGFLVIMIVRWAFKTPKLFPNGLSGTIKSTTNLNLENLPDEFTLNVNHDGIPDIPDTITIRVEHIGPGRDSDADDNDEEVETRDLTNEDISKMLAISQVHLELLKKLSDNDDTDYDEPLLQAVKDYANYLTNFERMFNPR